MAAKIFITGISTGVGKTIVSAIVAEILGADYWKPVQSGDLDSSDSQVISRLISRGSSRVHREEYRLSTPVSPHEAARIDGVKVQLDKLSLPDTSAPLVIEGAGGVLSPLSEAHLMVDLIVKLNLPCILVSRNYLGSINHTLMSLECLRARCIQVLGIIFNGNRTPSTENFIVEFSSVPLLGLIEEEPEWTPDVVQRYAHNWKDSFRSFI